MTTELTKAAQKNGPEVELCEQMQRAQARVRLLKPDDFDAPELDLSDSHTALFVLAEYWKGKHDKLKALTQRPAQQAGPDRACGVMHLIEDYAKAVHDGDDALCQVLLRTIEASPPAPQQATPEPVGEQATVPRDAYDALERERDYWRTRARAMIDHAEGTCWYWMGDGSDHPESMVNSLPVVIRAEQLRELLASPAPGVPDGLPAVLTDWGFDVHDDEEGRTWLLIRNDQDDVARLSVPTFWPASGRQTIGAVVLHQFSAALTSALAAAQAKGGE